MYPCPLISENGTGHSLKQSNRGCSPWITTRITRPDSSTPILLRSAISSLKREEIPRGGKQLAFGWFKSFLLLCFC
ncbi:unnamed protein product, partial [Vitis vinifera]